MGSTRTVIGFDDASRYVDSVSALGSKIEGLPKASENAGFKQLEALGLASDFPATFDSGVAEIASYVSTVSAGCTSYLKAVEEHDSSLYNKFVGAFPDTPISYEGPGGHGGGGGGGGSKPTPSAVNELSDEDEDKAKIDNTDKQEQYLSDISMDELDIIVQLLKNIANEQGIELDKLFSEEYSLLIKEKLLSELKVSQEFRDIVDEGSSISLVNALKSLVDGKLDTFKVDAVMASTLINSVDLYATKNNTTYSELISQSGNSELLKGAMTDFTKINDVTSTVNETSIQEKLLAIYEGNEVNLDSSDVIKGYVDALSESSGADYEKLLTDSSYMEKVYNETNSLNRISKYADLLSCCSKDQIVKSLIQINMKKTGSISTASSSLDSVFSTQPLVTLENIGG